MPRTQLSHVRERLTERLKTVRSSISGKPIKSAGQDENAATERQKLLEQEVRPLLLYLVSRSRSPHPSFLASGHRRTARPCCSSSEASEG